MRQNHKMRNLLGAALQAVALGLLWTSPPAADAAVPGITGATGAPTFNLVAHDAHTTQPDGASIYSWGYGCDPGQPTPGFLPLVNGTPFAGASCPVMQIPGPTMIVHENDVVTIKLTNQLPAAAGNTSMLFPGQQVATSGGTPGLLTAEAANGQTVTYTFTASKPGTYPYYSGTQGDLQIEMGLFGVLIVLPNAVPSAPAGFTVTSTSAGNCRPVAAQLPDGQTDFRLAASAYDHFATCYDREYLFQFSEIDPRIHTQVEDQILAGSAGPLNVATEPYHPAYFNINGRSMPDDMDPAYSPQYPNQPYNGNPHMHPGEMVLLRIVGTGRWQHPFHEHANHVRIIARDGNLVLSQVDSTKLAGPLLFTTTTTPGLAMDGLFYYTGKGLNWDMYGHGYNGDTTPCVPDANGYYTVKKDGTSAAREPNYFEWCADHGVALETHPFGNVASGGPVTLPNPNIVTNGAWYGGSPYLGAEATTRAVGVTGTTPPTGTVLNPPSLEAGFAYMWHSHNEREITTNNVFPGGMMMMMLVDAQQFTIDESL